MEGDGITWDVFLGEAVSYTGFIHLLIKLFWGRNVKMEVG